MLAHIVTCRSVFQEKRAICVEQLVPTNRPLPRIKLKILGPSVSGKTSLIQALQSNYISGFIRKKFRSSDRANSDEVGEYFTLRQRNLPSDLNFEVQHENYTRGITVNNVHINSERKSIIVDGNPRGNSS